MASSIESEITNLLMFGFHITNVNWTEMECVHELNKFTFFKKQWTWPELNSFFQIWMWSEFYSSKKGTYNALVQWCVVVASWKKIREITIFYKSVCTKVNYEECHKFSYGREGVSGGNGQKMREILVHNWWNPFHALWFMPWGYSNDFVNK